MIPTCKQYCSRTCKNSAQTRYSDAVRLFVANNIGSMNLRTIAKKTNVTYGGLRRQISSWRSKGYDVGGGRYIHYSRR
jgi:hypothetical protein